MEKLKSLTKEESFDVMYSQIFDENGDIKNRQLLNRSPPVSFGEI